MVCKMACLRIYEVYLEEKNMKQEHKSLDVFYSTILEALDAQ